MQRAKTSSLLIMLFFVYLLYSISRLKDLDIVYVLFKVFLIILLIFHCILGFGFIVVTTTGACSGFVSLVLPLSCDTLLHLKMCSLMPG